VPRGPEQLRAQHLLLGFLSVSRLGRPGLGTRAPHVLNAEDKKAVGDGSDVFLRAGPEQVSREPASEGSEGTVAFHTTRISRTYRGTFLRDPSTTEANRTKELLYLAWRSAAQLIAAAQSFLGYTCYLNYGTGRGIAI